ncbi:CGNR zinc finger domain-containing protein [Paenibacillus sp. ISL-20]|uniref:CGNR zinc finger domain-containing protein n=1 Tax=Paenibacillus sp. ISL-20 TaxID=2819163 RepID=UPI001BEA117E|nr:CGNR zinc finger domain-containing protein [Paenibacillus sp. ISL-20]MBT2762336.1 CGNR zinc finger domain-containing protein [Paenibacillus sp. ISL-20]
MPKKIAPEFYFIGNYPILDFVNTKIAVNGQPLDLLHDFEALLDWQVKANLLTEVEQNLRKAVWTGSEEETGIVEAARLLRDHLFNLIQPGSVNETSTEASLQFVNGLLQEQIIRTTLVAEGSAYSRKSRMLFRKPLDLLTPIAASAVDFLTTYDLKLVKKCENPACVLRFYDNSKNGTRRWCSPKTCGNRMKVAAYLERQKQQQTKES